MPLHVAEYGPADAPTIVFLHGGGGAGWMWRRQVEALRDEFHLLVPDLPEQGESTDAGPFSIEGAAAQVADLIRERAHGGEAAVVGLSEGAQVALALLASAPEVVTRAIVSSALVLPMPGTGMMSPGVLKWTYRTTIAPLKGSDWWIRLNMRSSAGIPDEYFDDFRRGFRAMTESGFTNMLAENQRFRLPEGLGRASVPTLVVFGQGEYDVMRRSAEATAEALHTTACEVRFGRKTSVAEAHNWSMTSPELFTRMVRAWMRDEPLPEELHALTTEGART